MTLVELFDEIGADLKKELIGNLISLDKSATGNLIRSVDYRLIVIEAQRLVRELKIEILAADYLKFVDEGRRPGSRMPPPSKLDKWIVARKLAPRDKKGKFISRKSLQFLIARAIQKNGIKPTNVIQKSVDAVIQRNRKKLEDAAVEQFNSIITSIFEK
jgi:hypothetical protein